MFLNDYFFSREVASMNNRKQTYFQIWENDSREADLIHAGLLLRCTSMNK